MLVFRLGESNGTGIQSRKCPLCQQSVKIGQTVAYLRGRQVVFHRPCLAGFVEQSYRLLPRQEDEEPGHELYAESKDQAQARAFEAYRARLQKGPYRNT